MAVLLTVRSSRQVKIVVVDGWFRVQMTLPTPPTRRAGLYCRQSVFSQTLNSIGWHHSSNQRHLLHFSIVLVFIVTKSQIWQKTRLKKFRRARAVFFSLFVRIVLRYIFIFELYLDSADGQTNLSKPVSEHCSKFRRVRPTRRGNHRRAAATTSTRRGNRVDAPRPPSPAIS